MVLAEMTGSSAFSFQGKGASVKGADMGTSGEREFFPGNAPSGGTLPFVGKKTNAGNRDDDERDCHSTFAPESQKKEICGVGHSKSGGHNACL
jgi:hypothetical protein